MLGNVPDVTHPNSLAKQNRDGGLLRGLRGANAGPSLLQTRVTQGTQPSSNSDHEADRSLLHGEDTIQTADDSTNNHSNRTRETTPQQRSEWL